jgi:uncharacterized membrane protein
VAVTDTSLTAPGVTPVPRRAEGEAPRTPDSRPSLSELVAGLADQPWTERLAGPLAALAERVAPAGERRRFLQGEWLGHALHPAMTDIPIGFWTSSMALDLLTGRSGRRASRRLIALGLVGSVPAMATGLAEWTRTDERTGRIGAVHGAANLSAAGVYFLSWRARRRGHHWRGMALGLLGGSIATASAYIGGHLAFAERVGVSERSDGSAAEEGYGETDGAGTGLPT